MTRLIVSTRSFFKKSTNCKTYNAFYLSIFDKIMIFQLSRYFTLLNG